MPGSSERQRPRRRVRPVVLVVILAVIVGVGTATAAAPTVLEKSASRTICADFTDAAGVYANNVVSLMGLPIGKIDRIEPRDGGVRMYLSVSDDVALPADVGAVVIDSSIVADRRVEFSRPYTSGPKFLGGACIPVQRTKTPRGVSEAYNALDKLLGDVLGSGTTSGGSATSDQIARLARLIDQNFSGRGTDLVGILRSVSALNGNPADTDAIMRRLIDNLDTLTQNSLQKWPDIAKVIATLNDTALALTGWAQEFAGTLQSAVRWVPIAADFMYRMGDRVLTIVEMLTPWVKVLAPYARTLAEMIAQLPGLATITDRIFTPSGALRVNWTPPSVALPSATLSQVCRVLQQPEACASQNAARSGLIQMIMRRAA